VVRTVYIGGRNLDDSPHSGVPRCLEESLVKSRNSLPVSELVSRRPSFGAQVDDLDPGQRVAQRLIVGIGIQRNDRNFGGQGVCYVVAKEFAGTDD
jgi:hypothetical protein